MTEMQTEKMNVVLRARGHHTDPPCKECEANAHWQIAAKDAVARKIAANEARIHAATWPAHEQGGSAMGLGVMMAQARTFTRSEVVAVLKCHRAGGPDSLEGDRLRDVYDHLIRVFERLE